MSFANQALSAQFIYNEENRKKLEKKVYAVPAEIDERISTLKLQAMEIDIDVLTDEQKKYLASWHMGT